jgi:hypothetical protein
MSQYNIIEKDKLNLYIRLKENVLTNEILNECSKLKIKTQFTSKIDEILGFDTNDYDHLIIKDIVKQKIRMEEKFWLESIKSDGNVSQVKLIFNEKNYENYLLKLWVLIGFQSKVQSPKTYYTNYNYNFIIISVTYKL